VVVFSHPEARLRWSGPPPKVVYVADARTDWVRWITAAKPKGRLFDPASVVAALVRLRTGTEGIETPRPGKTLDTA